MTAVLALEQVTKTFASGATTIAAVDHVDLHIEPGELVIIMGPSGSGKSTLLQMIGALLSPTSGTVTINGRRLDELTRRELSELRLSDIGFIFQGFNLLDALDAIENVAVPAALAGIDHRTRRSRALELLDDLGLADRTQHRPDQLSGGEKQRVAIARALVNNPALILGMEIIIERAATTRTTDTDQTLWFCSQLCAHKYDLNPTAYRPTLGRRGEPATRKPRAGIERNPQ